MAREPASHVLSQYAHCQTPGGWGMHVHTDRSAVSFEGWLAESVRRNHSAMQTHCNYDPSDLMTHHLGGGSLARAVAIVDGAYFVGITDHYDASVCLLRSTLAGKRACSCSSSREPTNVGPGTSANQPTRNKPGEVLVTGGARALLEQLTRADAIVYAHALARFYAGVVHYNLTCRLTQGSTPLGRTPVTRARSAAKRAAVSAHEAARKGHIGR